MSTKQNPCRHVIYSQNCGFVANFVDKAPTTALSVTYLKMCFVYRYTLLLTCSAASRARLDISSLLHLLVNLGTPLGSRWQSSRRVLLPLRHSGSWLVDIGALALGAGLAEGATTGALLETLRWMVSVRRLSLGAGRGRWPRLLLLLLLLIWPWWPGIKMAGLTVPSLAGIHTAIKQVAIHRVRIITFGWTWWASGSYTQIFTY